jgi:DNA (cytosine-5)-methyltransferase 3A
MNILSLFDGMSCGQIALNKVGIKYETYYSSEIDKDAIKVTQHNYPNTIQVGDVTKLSTTNLPKIDLLIGGSPCQGFSFAGKQLNFEDPRSKLFFEFVRLKNELQPKYFLLENVKMKKSSEDVITEYLGVKPILINSHLVSGQHRRRLYWTNIPGVEQPEDKGILLKDILDKNVDGTKIEFDSNGEFQMTAKNGKLIRLNNRVEIPYTIYETRTELGKSERKRIRELHGIDSTPRTKEHKEYLPLKTKKSNCLLTGESTLDYILDSNLNFRTYTINELERLQTLPVNYTNIGLSKNKIRKMIGNGWTVDVISHIFKNIEI